MSTLLFYAGQLVEEVTTSKLLGLGLSRYIQTIHGQEIYDGGYLYMPYRSSKPNDWYRCDLTPYFTEDVPKELRLLVLLMER